MQDAELSKLEWWADLLEQVDRELRQINEPSHGNVAALEYELQQINERQCGYDASLAKPNLSADVREAIETRWDLDLQRKKEIEASLIERASRKTSVDQIVEPAEVLDRLERLADVLAANNPTRGNLELSLHIDRIVCSADGTVVLRTCKLGTLTEALDIFATPEQLEAAVHANEPISRMQGKPRLRGRLRVFSDVGDRDDVEALKDFVANPHRFAGLSDQWFWTDNFEIPGASPSWAQDHAEEVFIRRQKTKWSYAKLAIEFHVTAPTIGAAIRSYLATHPEEQDIELQRGGKRKPKYDLATFADEARQLWIDGASKEKLAQKYGCSAPTVGKAIAFAYKREGLTMPNREEAYRSKAEEARRLLDDGKTLEEIAARMKISNVTARQYLRDSFSASGQAMPDLRRRKGT